MLPVPRDRDGIKPQNREEARYESEMRDWLREETAYQAIQGTKPQTLTYGLTDSPVGLAAWICEKFRTWSDCDGEIERVFNRDELLTNNDLLAHRRDR